MTETNTPATVTTVMSTSAATVLVHTLDRLGVLADLETTRVDAGMRVTLTGPQLAALHRNRDGRLGDATVDAAGAVLWIGGARHDLTPHTDPRNAERAPILAGLLGDPGDRFYTPGTADPLDPAETAYDGSTQPPKRDLTARERDVLCRTLRHVLKDDRYRLEELYTLAAIRHVIDPRTD